MARSGLRIDEWSATENTAKQLLTVMDSDQREAEGAEGACELRYREPTFAGPCSCRAERLE